MDTEYRGGNPPVKGKKIIFEGIESYGRVLVGEEGRYLTLYDMTGKIVLPSGLESFENRYGLEVVSITQDQTRALFRILPLREE